MTTTQPHSTSSADRSVDPVTLEVIRSLLKHNLDEVELTMCRTAYSSTIYEVRDMCAGWIDASGRLIAQGRYGLPIFMADLATSVTPGIDLYGLDGFEPGDVVITNHAESCGQHLNNVVVYSPIFAGSEVVAFTATRAHWADVGGKAVGSWATDSTEIFQEGVQWDTLKVFKAGVQDEEVVRMIKANVRFPDQVLGDMRAQITACRLGERRFAEMIDKYGMDTLQACVERIWEQSEQRARSVVGDIPDGTYRASAFLDNDGVVMDETLNIDVAVIVEGTEMTVDLTGTHAQARGPMNSGIAGALAAARVAFKCITSPGSTPDEGAFRPLSLVVPDGTFVSAVSPAPLAQWSTPLPTVIEAILTALAPAIPDKIPAAHMGDLAANFIYQQATADSPGFIHADPFPGGWGARPHGDGPVPLKSYAHGDTYKISAELEELKYPFRVTRYELRTDSAGAGTFRGGPGIDREFEFLEDVMITTSLERSKCPPWGLMGGGPGSPPVATLVLRDGSVERFNKATMKPVPAGSRLTVSTAGGGGYGPPHERDPDAVLVDVRRGFVTAEAARTVYGVHTTGSGREAEIDGAATAADRSARADGQSADGSSS
jgi:N-methylhydantoinase B